MTNHVVFNRYPKYVDELVLQFDLVDPLTPVDKVISVIGTYANDNHMALWKESHRKCSAILRWLRKVKEDRIDGKLVEPVDSIKRRMSKALHIRSSRIEILEASYEHGICESAVYSLDGHEAQFQYKFQTGEISQVA